MSIYYWTYQNGDNLVINNRNYHYDNIRNGRYLLLIDTEIYSDTAVNNNEASIGFSTMDDIFSVTRCYNKYSCNIYGNTIVNIFDGTLDINVKPKFIDTFRFDHFKITLIPIQE